MPAECLQLSDGAQNCAWFGCLQDSFCARITTRIVTQANANNSAISTVTVSSVKINSDYATLRCLDKATHKPPQQVVAAGDSSLVPAESLLPCLQQRNMNMLQSSSVDTLTCMFGMSLQ